MATSVSTKPALDQQKTDAWKNPVKRLKLTILELAVHALIVLIALALFHLVRKTLEILSGTKDSKLFDVIPLRYIFDGADLFLLVGFLILGTYFSLRAYRGKEV